MAAELDGYPSHCRFMQAQFEGQTKTKLGNTKVKTITNEAIS
jgi:DNA gyrase/topoisomerase IV subunit B